MQFNSTVSTFIGVSAIFMWSTLVGLIHWMSLKMDPLASLMLLYSLSTLILLIIFKKPNFNTIPLKYTIILIVLFVAYELCFAFSIALAKTPTQTIEVGVINHLWPTFTIFMMIMVRYLKISGSLLLGLALSAFGVLIIQTDGFNLSWSNVQLNILSNPISYILALSAAMIWAFYCVVIMKYKPENNLIVALFFFTSLSLVIKWLYVNGLTGPKMPIELSFILIAASVCLSIGYAAWNIGMIHGNAKILVSSSYFIPILSAAFSALLFQVQLDAYFWGGTMMVVLGSLVCWLTMENKVPVNC